MTKKDAYYFPHDSNAKRDPKLMLLRHQLGAQGYGVYWMLIEDLREQEDYSLPLMIVPALAHEYNISEQILKTIIQNFGLFEVHNEQFFFSPSLIRRMENWNVKKAISKERAKKAAAARWQKALGESKPDAQFNNSESTSNAQAMPEQNTSNADAMQPDAIREEKRREEKKREEENTYIGACASEIMKYFNFTETNNFDKLREAHQFASVLNHRNRLNYFQEQFKAYRAYKNQSGEKVHTFSRFLGTPNSYYEDGGWNARNWKSELSDQSTSQKQSVDEIMSKI